MAKNKKTVQKVSNEDEPVKNEEKYLRVTGDPSTKVNYNEISLHIFFFFLTAI